MNVMESTLSSEKLKRRMTHLRTNSGQCNQERVKVSKPHITIMGCNKMVQNAFELHLSNDFNLNQHKIDSYVVNWDELHCIDIIVINLNAKGLQLAQSIKNHPYTSRIPLIFLSTENNYLNELKGMKLGAVDIIAGSVNFNILRFKILNILNHLQFNKVDPQEQNLDLNQAIQKAKEDDFLRKVIHTIKEHIDDSDLNVKKLSHLLSVSPNYVYRRIKRKTGYTVKRFILLERLKVSAKLLKQSDKNVSEVAYMVGFDSPGYFSRCFREYYTCSPKDYRDIDS